LSPGNRFRRDLEVMKQEEMQRKIPDPEDTRKPPQEPEIEDSVTSEDSASQEGGRFTSDEPLAPGAQVEAKPAVMYQRPVKPAQQSKTEKPIVPLRELSGFLPTGERWNERWKGEPDEASPGALR
jgi:hypothetical protein